MAYQIINESYGPRKPKVAIEADSLDELSGLTGFAEGSTAVVGGTEYILDRVNGWVEPGQGGGGGGGSSSVMVVSATNNAGKYTLNLTYGAALAAAQAGKVIFFSAGNDTYKHFGLLYYIEKGDADTYSAQGKESWHDNNTVSGSGNENDPIVLEGNIS